MGAETTAHELGHLASVKANSARVVNEPESPSDTQTKRDYVDNDQLARIGKKQVLKVCFTSIQLGLRINNIARCAAPPIMVPPCPCPLIS